MKLIRSVLLFAVTIIGAYYLSAPFQVIASVVICCLLGEIILIGWVCALILSLCTWPFNGQLSVPPLVYPFTLYPPLFQVTFWIYFPLFLYLAVCLKGKSAAHTRDTLPLPVKQAAALSAEPGKSAA